MPGRIRVIAALAVRVRQRQGTIFNVDSARCRLASKALNPDDDFSARGSVAFVIGATLLHGIGRTAVRQSDYNDCMEGNG
jgi:hypothetical protein